MRDFLGAHVSKVNLFNEQKDIDDVYISTMVRGSFRVKYHASDASDIGTLFLEVAKNLGGTGVSMQLTLEQAVLLQELLAAGIADMRAALADRASSVLELPAGGDAA